MEFFPRRKKSPPAVIIVALIDVLIVILIFLLVTTTFKQTPALKLTLPESSQGTREGASELTPVLVTIDRQGSVYLGARSSPVTFDVLEREIGALVKVNPRLQVAVEPDEAAPMGVFVKVTDAIRAAGVKTGMTLHTRTKEAP
ncbi:MAG TPA: hypothetical protein DCY13_14785 [Verrucomicrobiales bacterium]|nr:hypothetical protein [Verrucomicrobiales bacterium]